jgi:hypothetical protein
MYKAASNGRRPCLATYSFCCLLPLSNVRRDSPRDWFSPKRLQPSILVSEPFLCAPVKISGAATQTPHLFPASIANGRPMGFCEVIQAVDPVGGVILHEEHDTGSVFCPREQEQMIGAEVEHGSKFQDQRAGVMSSRSRRQRR